MPWKDDDDDTTTIVIVFFSTQQPKCELIVRNVINHPVTVSNAFRENESSRDIPLSFRVRSLARSHAYRSGFLSLQYFFLSHNGNSRRALHNRGINRVSVVVQSKTDFDSISALLMVSNDAAVFCPRSLSSYYFATDECYIVLARIVNERWRLYARHLP